MSHTALNPKRHGAEDFLFLLLKLCLVLKKIKMKVRISLAPMHLFCHAFYLSFPVARAKRETQSVIVTVSTR